MSESKKYAGSCHCGKVSYDVDLAVDSAISCNCSMCRRKGTLLTFVPEASFSLKSGDEVLTDYLFNKHAIHHLFCSSCGVTSFARGVAPDGKKMVAINVRCLDGVELDALKIQKFDGASH